MSSKSSSASSPTKKGSSNIWPWIIRLIIFIVVVIIGIYLWNVVGSALTQALASILGMIGAFGNTVTQQLDKCGFTSQKQISCNGASDCKKAGMEDGECTSGVCTDCGPTKKCSKGSCSALDANKRGTCSSAGLFASGCYMGWGIIGYVFFQVLLVIGGIFGARKWNRSKLAEQSEAETGSQNANVDSLNQSELEEAAKNAAEDAVKKGKISEDSKTDMTESTLNQSVSNNAVDKIHEAITQNTGTNPTQKVQALKTLADNKATVDQERLKADEENTGSEEEGENVNEAAKEAAKDLFPVDSMSLMIAQAHMKFAQTHPDPAARKRHAALGARATKRLQQRKRKEKAASFQTSTLPQGNPIMPTTTTCGGIDYANLCEPPVIEIECAPDCFDPGFGCCDKEAIYDCNWRSPNFGGLTACK